MSYRDPLHIRGSISSRQTCHDNGVRYEILPAPSNHLRFPEHGLVPYYRPHRTRRFLAATLARLHRYFEPSPHYCHRGGDPEYAPKCHIAAQFEMLVVTIRIVRAVALIGKFADQWFMTMSRWFGTCSSWWLRERESERFRDQLSGISASLAKSGPGRSRATACAPVIPLLLLLVYIDLPRLLVVIVVVVCSFRAGAVLRRSVLLLFSSRTKERRRSAESCAERTRSAFGFSIPLTFVIYVYSKLSLLYAYHS